MPMSLPKLQIFSSVEPAFNLRNWYIYTFHCLLLWERSKKKMFQPHFYFGLWGPLSLIAILWDVRYLFPFNSWGGQCVTIWLRRFPAFKSFLSYKLRYYTRISSSEKSCNKTRKKIRYNFSVFLISPISCWHVTPLSRHSISIQGRFSELFRVMAAKH